jgi:membrane protease YdiL (CAAX protease family)
MPLAPLTSATYALLFASVLALWAPWRFAWAWLLAASVLLGYAGGILSGPAVVPLVVLAAACWRYHHAAHPSLPVQAALAIVVLLVALGLGLHAFPGFANALLWHDITFSPNSAPYTLYLNVDKTLAGLLILGLCYDGLLVSREGWAAMLRRAAPIVAVNTLVVIGLALALGFVRFDPKWTTLFWPWAVVNLLFTCVAEEAFFRGLIQRQLDRRLPVRHKTAIAVGTSAILFGLAHAAGGPAYVLLSTVAGLGYALAFQRTQRIEVAILAHFTLNATHFLLLTYPRVS